MRSRIEFSRRKFDAGYCFEPVDASIILKHKIHPILVNHYSLDTALRQKLEALAGRSETQARDIFDIDLLLRAGAKFSKRISGAFEKVKSITYAEYKSQVVAFLEPENQAQYGSSDTWSGIVARVIKALRP
jgi:hypothetical protein